MGLKPRKRHRVRLRANRTNRTHGMIFVDRDGYGYAEALCPEGFQDLTGYIFPPGHRATFTLTITPEDSTE